jgi:hypothetical protein
MHIAVMPEEEDANSTQPRRNLVTLSALQSPLSLSSHVVSNW